MADHIGVIAYPDKPGMKTTLDRGTHTVGGMTSIARGAPPFNPHAKGLEKRADKKKRKYWG